MKKTFLIFLVLIIFSNYTNADSDTNECLIKDSSSEVLLKYIQDNRQIIKNITKGIVNFKNASNSSNGTIINKAIKNSQNSYDETSALFNSLFDFSGYDSYFLYFTLYPLFNDVPYQASRDYKMLSNESEGMLKYLTRLSKKGLSRIEIKEACKGVEKYCKTILEPQGDNLTSKEIIGKLIQNNNRILELYRLTVMGANSNFEKEKLLFLVGNNFKFDIDKYYGPKALDSCSQDGGFSERINKSIQNIKLITEQSSNGIQKWENAINLAMGNGTEQENKEAESAFQKYKANSGKGNVEYKENKLDLKNNFISNSYKISKDSIEKKLKKWEETNVGDFFDKKELKKLDINKFKTIEENLNTSNSIKRNIETIYQNELQFLLVSDNYINNIEDKIIKLHFDLSESINILDKTIGISNRTCLEQDKNGPCPK